MLQPQSKRTPERLGALSVQEVAPLSGHQYTWQSSGSLGGWLCTCAEFHCVWLHGDHKELPHTSICNCTHHQSKVRVAPPQRALTAGRTWFSPGDTEASSCQGCHMLNFKVMHIKKLGRKQIGCLDKTNIPFLFKNYLKIVSLSVTMSRAESNHLLNATSSKLYINISHYPQFSCPTVNII